LNVFGDECKDLLYLSEVISVGIDNGFTKLCKLVVTGALKVGFSKAVGFKKVFCQVGPVSKVFVGAVVRDLYLGQLYLK